MRVKGVTDEDFVNYKIPSMYICTCFCNFKCDKESGESCCQNSSLAQQESMYIDDDILIQRYIDNRITNAIVFAGLEPFDQYLELFQFIAKLREQYRCSDTVVIYTGYNKEEIADRVRALKQFGNIIIKFGRFLPDKEKHFDDVLGVSLASGNQYAEVIC